MLKIVALISMLSDHLAKTAFFNANTYLIYIIMVIVGRFSMPIFGYCIARGYNHYKQNGNMKKYFKNLTIFSIISQIPFTIYYLYCFKLNFIASCKLNIGFTWLFSLLFLYILEKTDFSTTKQNLLKIGILISIVLVTIFISMDYGFYGFLFPIIFYFFCFKYDSPILLVLANVANYFIYYIINFSSMSSFSHQTQIFSIFSIFLIWGLQKYDKKVRLPKFVFYWFYPVHLFLLILLKLYLNTNFA